MEEKKVIKIGLKTAVLLIVLFIAVVIGMMWEAVYKYYNPTTTEQQSSTVRVVGVK